MNKNKKKETLVTILPKAQSLGMDGVRYPGSDLKDISHSGY